MKWIVLPALLVLLYSLNPSFAQYVDDEPTLAIVFSNYSPYYFTDEEGYTVVIGQVENTKNYPITGVQIRGTFYNDFSNQPVDFAVGTTTLEVIPPFGKSTYMITSRSANPEITNVSVTLGGFNTAQSKLEGLVVKTQDVLVGDTIKITGNITNNGPITATGTQIYFAFYDVFDPPRILSLVNKTINEIPPNSSVEFEIDEPGQLHLAGFVAFAESKNYLSNFEDVSLPESVIVTKLVTIDDLSITNSKGEKISNLQVGSPVALQSRVWIQYSGEQQVEQSYVYYTQIKQSGDQAFVEFIGKFEGKFEDTSQFPAVEWIPENSGIFFIETFVWDSKSVPIASTGPISLILVE